MTDWERYLADSAAIVVRNHGDGAVAFATERLAFCRDADYAYGIALWQGVLDVLTASPPKDATNGTTPH